MTGTKILFVKSLKVIYGCTESTMLWYDYLYKNTLKDICFKLIHLVDALLMEELVTSNARLYSTFMTTRFLMWIQRC